MTSNYRIEHINFYVADFNIAYHAILGWPALAKFMVVPHYAYLVLKMPSPIGVLALWAKLSIAYAYKTKSLCHTQFHKTKSNAHHMYARICLFIHAMTI